MPQPMAIVAGALFAAATGLGFLRDWLVVSGALNPDAPGFGRAQSALYRLFGVWLPPLWRLLLVIAMAVVLRAGWPLPPAGWRELLAGWGVPAAGVVAGLAAALALVGGALVGLGVLPRLLSVALAVPIGFDIAARGLCWYNGLALVATTFIQLLGPGLFALWPAEERFVFRRLGGR